MVKRIRNVLDLKDSIVDFYFLLLIFNLYVAFVKEEQYKEIF